jgi:hypothetical protein
VETFLDSHYVKNVCIPFDIKTEELTLEDIGVHAKELTGEFKSCVILLLNVIPLFGFDN